MPRWKTGGVFAQGSQPMRFSVRDLTWLVTGMAIAFAIVGSIWRREHASWIQERAGLQSDIAQEKDRAAKAERNMKYLNQDLADPEVIRELVIAAEVEQQFRKQGARQGTPDPIPHPSRSN
jgi:hypothetical protein